MIDKFISGIEHRELIVAYFDDKSWVADIDQVTFRRDGAMMFRFKNGDEVGN